MNETRHLWWVLVVFLSGVACSDGGSAVDAGDDAGIETTGEAGDDSGTGEDAAAPDDASDGEAFCPDGATCMADFPCFADPSYYAHCDGSVRMTPQ